MRKYRFIDGNYLCLCAMLLAVFLGTLGIQQARAQEKYETIEPPQPTASSAKVEVVDVFSYACPHCYAFQPTIERIKAMLGEDVLFKRMPVVFRESWEIYAKAYYTAELLGVLDQTHFPLFEALHQERKDLSTEDSMAAFFASRGVNEEMFRKTFNSSAVDTKMRLTRIRQTRYGIRSTPTVVVNGKYRVNRGTAASDAETLEVIRALVAKERKALSD